MVTTLLLLVVFISGCLDYKAYDIPQEEQTENVDLINEIAAIEAELEEEAAEEVDTEEVMEEEVVVEEVVLPEITEETSAEMQVITVDEDEMVQLNVRVTDPDGDNVTYSFTPPLNNQGEWKTNYGDAGEYLSTLRATDGKLTTEKALKIVVNRVNVPPTITGVKDIRVREGAVVTFTPTVADPNGDKVTTTISEPLASGTFNTDHTSAGEYQISVTASDGELETHESFLLTIDDVNELPVITNVEDLTIQEGERVEINPIVADLDEDEVVVTISEPVGDDGVWETNFMDNGVYQVKITVDDGKDTVHQTITLTVQDINMPPEIVDVSLQTS